MDSPYLGMIQYFAFDWAPKGYALCNGALLPIAQNQALFALLGTFYGGNGTSNFGLPDLRGRAMISQGTNFTMGEKLGAEHATLLTTNMPMHTHTATGVISAFNNPRGSGDQNDPTSNYPSSTNTGNMYSAALQANSFLGAPTVTVGTAGSNVPFNTLNPYLALTCAIATSGLFPSRN